MFIDDILIYSRTEEEYEQHVMMAFQTLSDHHLFAKSNKFEFWLKEVKFLSYFVSQDGIWVDTFKTDTILSWNRSMSPFEVKSFLGLVGFYRRFIEGFSKIASPLTNLTKKDQKFK